MRELGGEDIEFDVHLSESVLARLYFVIRVAPGSRAEYDVSEIEARLREITRDWADDLRNALLDHCGEERGLSLYRRYGDGFRADYREHYVPRIAVYDVEQMESLSDDEHSIAMSLYRPLEAPEGMLQFKLFRAERPISLSDALPMLGNMGLRVEDERPSEIRRADGSCVWMHDFSMRFGGKGELDLDEEKTNVNGGAIALGHPLGCTGAKLTVQIVNEMKRRQSQFGMVTMCIGGGMGAAGIFENLN